MPRVTRWWDEADLPRHYCVAPDGCRDLLLIRRPGCAPLWRMTPLDLRASAGRAEAGTRFDGFRLSPGSEVDIDRLSRALRGVEEPETGAAVLHDHLRPATTLDEALAALADPDCPEVAAAARGTGLSLRSLQRLVSTGTGQAPLWWMRLARVRRAALALSQAAPVEVAADHGYADQSHLSREMRHFLRATPGAVRRGEGPPIHSGHGTY